MNISMQLLGRVAIIFGTLLVSMLNLIVFSDSSEMTELEKINAYGEIYLYSFDCSINFNIRDCFSLF